MGGTGRKANGIDQPGGRGRQRGRLCGSGARRPLPPAAAALRRVRTRPRPGPSTPTAGRKSWSGRCRCRRSSRRRCSTRTGCPTVSRRGTGRRGAAASRGAASTRRPTDPAVRRAVEAAQAAAPIPDHPRLDQVFDVFAEGGSLWIVSELVAARPLAALLAEKPLTPYRAAEVASDVLMALRVLHAHGWVHRNITARTVLVCDDGRVMLTGLAVGAAEEALCGYDPVPAEDEDDRAAGPGRADGGVRAGGFGGAGSASGPRPRRHAQCATGVRWAPAQVGPADARGRSAGRHRGACGRRAAGARGDAGTGRGRRPRRARGPSETGGDVRAARAGAIAAYRAGARAAARVQEAQQNGRAALPGARPAPEDGPAPWPTARPAAVRLRQRRHHAAGPDRRPLRRAAPSWHGASPAAGRRRPATGARPPARARRPRRAPPAARVTRAVRPGAGGTTAGGMPPAARGVPRCRGRPGTGGRPRAAAAAMACRRRRTGPRAGVTARRWPAPRTAPCPLGRARRRRRPRAAAGPPPRSPPSGPGRPGWPSSGP